MMRVKDIKPGMKGYGLTVFKGTKIERFDVEILGVLPKDNITGDIILARLSGGPITQRNAKVIAGMSGSPVYINGKLIGAVALTWLYSLEPLAGITPIENMIASANKIVPIGGAPVTIKSSTLRSMGLKNLGDGDSITMVPIAIPLIASGFHPKVLEKASSIFREKGFIFMQSPGGGKMNVKAPLAPGAAFGCQLMSGDMQITGIGTLTYIDENGEWLAFGHSMMDMGDAQLPAVTAYIHDVIPSVAFSTKLGSPAETVGSLTHDGYFAISGKLGMAPKMVPVSITVLNGDKNQKFNVEVAKHPSLTNSLIGTAISNAVFLSCPDPVDVMTKVSFDIQFEGGKHLSKKDVFYSPSGAGIDPSFFIEDILFLLSDNVFQAVYPERVNVQISVEKGRKVARIEKLAVDKNIVKPGETLTLTVYLKKYGSDEQITMPISLTIPYQAPEGRANIYVGGGNYISPQVMGFKSPTNLSDLLKFIEDIPQNNQIVVSLVMPRFRIQLEDKLLSPLPSGIEEMITTSKETALRRVPYVSLSTIDTEWFVMGVQRISVIISKTGKAPAFAPSPEAPQPGAQPAVEASSGDEEGAFFFTKASPVLSSLLKTATPQQPAQPPQAPAQQPSEAPQMPPTPPSPPSKPSKRIWIQSKYEDFSQGDTNNTVLTRGGEIILAPKWKKIATLPGSLLLSVLDEGDYYLASTLGTGAIYKVSQDGKVEQVIKTKEVGLKLLNWQGKTLAISFPGGNIYTVDISNRSLSTFVNLPVDYIWDFLPKGDRLLIAGGGEKGFLYSLSPDGKATLLYIAPDQHIVKIGEKEDSLILGTSPQGLVIFYKESGSSFYSSNSQTVSAIAYINGDVYVGCAPGGRILKIDSKGISEIADTKERAIYSLTGGSNYLLAGTGDRGRIYLIDPSQQDRWGFAFQADSSDITGFLKTDKGIIALGSNPPTIFLSTSSYSEVGTFTSSVFDGAITCQWGRVVVDADVPSACKLEIETRSGNSPLPDEGWSLWTPLGPQGEILSPPARYLQYRAKLSTTNPSQTPSLRRVTVYLLPQNLPPSLTISSPNWGDILSGTADIKWSASDPNNDSLITTIYISENGKDWQKIGEVSEKNQFQFNTKDRKDGRYLLKLVVSDAGSNPPSTALSTEKTVGITIDNTPPRITIFKESAKIEGGKIYLEGIAEDSLSPITEVVYSLGDNIFYSATPVKGIFSTTSEPFTISATIPEGNPSQVTIKIKAKDFARNETTSELRITISKEGKIEKIEEVKPEKKEAQPSQAQKQQKGETKPPAKSQPSSTQTSTDDDDEIDFSAM